MTDLTDLKVIDEAIEMPIYHPVTGEKTDIVISVLGADSDEYKRTARNIYKAALKKAPKGDIGKLNEDDDEAFANKLKIAHIKGWQGIEINGEPFPYSAENAVRLVKDFPWIADQVNAFVEDRANFIKG